LGNKMQAQMMQQQLKSFDGLRCVEYTS
jgi:hypothetical protein